MTCLLFIIKIYKEFESILVEYLGILSQNMRRKKGEITE